MEPRITLPGVLIHNRCYELAINIPPAWRTNTSVSFEILFQAHRNIYCFPLGAFKETECEKCGKILSIEKNEPCAFSTDAATGWEKYVYRFRPQCSSTRNHFEGKPIIAALLASTKCPPILSNPFTIIAKEQRASTKRRQAERLAAEAAAAALIAAKVSAGTSTSTSPASGSSSSSSYTPHARASLTPASAVNMEIDDSSDESSSGGPVSPPTSLTQTQAIPLTPPTQPGNPFAQAPVTAAAAAAVQTAGPGGAPFSFSLNSDFGVNLSPIPQVQLLQLQQMQSPAVPRVIGNPLLMPENSAVADRFFVMIRRFNQESESVLKEISHAYVQRLHQVVPHCVVKYNVSGSTVVSVTAFETPEDARLAMTFGRMWLSEQFRKSGLQMLSIVRF